MVALWAGLLAAPAPAFDLDMQVALGFSGAFRLDHWTPVGVTVENRGEAVGGRLEVVVRGGSELAGDLATTTYRQPIALARGARKRVGFTVRLEGLSHPLVVRFTDGERELARVEIDLRTRFTDRRLLLVLGRDADLDYLNAAPGKEVRVLYPHPSTLPERWQGYDAVAAVITHGFSLEDLTERQHDALEKWLAHGGVLVVGGGPNYRLLATPRLARLLPAVPAGLVRVADAAEVARAFGVPLTLAGPVDLHRIGRVPPGRGRVVHAAASVGGGEVPLVLERRLGRGRVVHLTFDVARYPFDRWSGMSEVWWSVLDLPPAARAALAEEAPRRHGPTQTALRDPSLEFPAHATLLGFLILYGAALLTALAFSRPGRPPGRWRALLAWGPALAFAPAAYFVFGPLLFPARATAVVLSVVEPLGAGPYALVTFDAAHYAVHARPERWRFAGVEPTLVPLRESRHHASEADWVVAEGEPFAAGPASPRPYVVYRLRGRDVTRFELAKGVREGPDGVTLTLATRTGVVLDDAWVVIGDTAYPVGPVTGAAEGPATLLASRAGAVRLRTVQSWWHLFGERGSLPIEAQVKEALLERALVDRFPPAPREALLIGFAPSPVRTRAPPGRWSSLEMALVVQTLPLEVTPSSAGPADEGGPEL